MAETVITLILFFNVAFVILYFILRIHRHMVEKANRGHAKDPAPDKNPGDK